MPQRPHFQHPYAYVFLAVVLCIACGAPVFGDFPPITDVEKTMTEVPGDPGAPAVILFKNGELFLQDLVRETPARMDVAIRIKILKEEGLGYGEAEIEHSRSMRLRNLEARTVSPSGEVTTVADDAIFRERRSRSAKEFVTKLAFPKVEVGSILDYSYQLYWDNAFLLEPWLFQDELPMMQSKISYFKPDNLGVKVWWNQTGVAEIETSQERNAKGKSINAWMGQMPAIPDEPYTWPDVDLASRYMLIPVSVSGPGYKVDLISDWKHVCEVYGDGSYKEFKKKGRNDVKARAQTLAKGKQGHEAIDAVYMFVRDEVDTLLSWDIWLDDGRKATDLLETGKGTSVEKVLLLEAMLDALKIKTHRMWVTDRRVSTPDLTVANPAWFTGAVLAAEVEGGVVYLDPSDPGLRPGVLSPGLDGTQAINCSDKPPATVQLPVFNSDANQRKAKIALSINEEGQMSGAGMLQLQGRPAWRYLGAFENDEKAVESWQKELDESFKAYAVSGVSVSEDVSAQKIIVTWNQVQHEDDVLGDEISLLPSVPLERSQPFTLEAEQRRSPVRMPNTAHDDLTLEITWPPGWQADALPKAANYTGAAGSFAAAISVDEEARSLRYERRFDLDKTHFMNSDDYRAVQELFATAAAHDGQELVLSQP